MFRRALFVVLYQVPSPKLQFQENGVPPVEVSLNSTVSGAGPAVGVTEKPATGGRIWLATVIVVPGSVRFEPMVFETSSCA